MTPSVPREFCVSGLTREGSGSLLLQAKKQFDEHIIEDGFFGQEINHTTYNLARMNMFCIMLTMINLI